VKIFVRVLTVHQSPRNVTRWLVTLECGHKEWVTRISKPRFKKRHCYQCAVKKLDGVA